MRTISRKGLYKSTGRQVYEEQVPRPLGRSRLRSRPGFDRDSTIDVNPSEKGAVPLEWVKYLAHETEHYVWAHGNQKLVEEADIPGDERALELYEDRWGDPIDHLDDRLESHLEEWIDPPDYAPDPDLVNALADKKRTGDRPTRDQRVRLLGSLLPECDEYIVVDNRYLGYLDGWTFYYPWDFVDTVREFTEMVEYEV